MLVSLKVIRFGFCKMSRLHGACIRNYSPVIATTPDYDAAMLRYVNLRNAILQRWIRGCVGWILESCASNIDIVLHVMFTLWSDKWRCWLQCVDASLLSSEAKTMPVAWKMSPPPPHFGNRRRTKLFKQKRLQQKRAVGDSEAFLLPFSELRRVPVRQVAIAVMDHYVWQLQHTIIIALFILSTEVPVQRGNWYLIPHSHVWSVSLAL